MTTWELANDAQKQELLTLLNKLRTQRITLPNLPATARDANLEGLTKRDAGTVITLLREAWNERDE